MTRHVYQFGPFELDVLTKRLFRGEEPIALAPKAFDLLLLLVTERGRLVEKSELMQRLWPTTFVEEANLTQHVFTLRRALGDQPDGRPYIDTVPRRGYLFAADVNEIVETAPLADRPWWRTRTAAFALAVTAGLVLSVLSWRMIADRRAETTTTTLPA